MARNDSPIGPPVLRGAAASGPAATAVDASQIGPQRSCRLRRKLWFQEFPLALSGAPCGPVRSASRLVSTSATAWPWLTAAAQPCATSSATGSGAGGADSGCAAPSARRRQRAV